ncbi:hypothetical protein A2U01_0098525, partial [Trifolium medium]|nr:hypothetical protein [Trifolium medium]
MTGKAIQAKEEQCIIE